MFTCEICSNNYMSFKALRQHALQKHSDNVETAFSRPEKKYKCGECQKQYNNKQSFSRHEKSEHNIKYVNVSRLYKCGLCDYKHYDKCSILSHTFSFHDVSVTPETKTFQCELDFLEWKNNEQKINKCKFVATGGKHKNQNVHSQTLICHRSQYYEPKGNFQRSLKFKGSCKFQAFCPAEIKYKESAGIYNVSYVKNHTHNRLFDQVITHHKGKLTSKIKDLRKRHTASLQLDDTLITEYDGGWICPSSRQIETYFIQKNKEICTCHLRCNICNYCIHNFVCTCNDNTVQWNMCKHIHLLCRSKHNLLVDSTTDNQNDSLVECPKLEEKILTELTRETLPKQENLNEIRGDLLQSFKEMLDDADADQLQFIKTEVKSLKSTVDILKKSTAYLENNDQNKEEQLKREPSNKQMEPQRRLFSTKKKAQRKTETIVKPSLEEKNNISLNMLLNRTNKD